MQNVSSESEECVALSAAATLLAKQHIYVMEMHFTANGRQVWVSARTTDGRPLYVEVAIGSNTEKESENGGNPKA
jgi:hypothetical protein